MFLTVPGIRYENIDVCHEYAALKKPLFNHCEKTSSSTILGKVSFQQSPIGQRTQNPHLAPFKAIRFLLDHFVFLFIGAGRITDLHLIMGLRILYCALHGVNMPQKR